jgi:long-chain acyl-CoA synthetase
MRTIPELFEQGVEKFANRPFLWEKRNNSFESTSYKNVREEIYKISAGLSQIGVSKGDRVALISEARNYWVTGELGLLYQGAVNVPLSIKLEPADLEFRINHAQCKMLMVSASQLRKIKEIKDKLTTVETYILFDEQEQYEENEICISEVIAKGEEYLKEKRADFIEAWQVRIQEDTDANICYTSGTTADPKGIVLTHLNYVANVKQAESLMIIPPHYKTLILLALDHSFAHTAGIFTFMKMGASLGFVQVGKTASETIKNIPINIKEFKPHLMMSVPAVAKNFKKNIEKGIRDKGPKVEKLFNKAMKTAYDYNGIGWDKGKGFKIFKKPMLWFYDKILFSKIREGFGGNLEFFIGGGALLDIEIQRFFYAIGMPMYQGYGLSEAAPVISSNSPISHKMGSSGYLAKDLELKICNDKGVELPTGEKGEIVVKGENVMKGYWRNESATSETLKNGWLHTGDMGFMDADGFLFVMGRFKSLLIGSDGEKYSPEGIEETLPEHSAILEQCMLHNNQDAYTTGFFYPNTEGLKRVLKKKGIALSDEKAIDTALELIQLEINEYKKGGMYEGMFPERWLPSTYAVLPEGFTEPNGMLNSMFKMVRNKINEAYPEKFEFLYMAEGKNPNNKMNREVLKKLLS